MAVTLFGAIDIGSYDVTLEIFEISAKTGIHCIDKVRHRIELGTDSYSKGKIGPEMVTELCDVLKDYRHIMKEYKVDAYSVIATSAIREAENDLFILGKIKQTTGLEVRILSNSESRFLEYKAISSMEIRFEDMIRTGTAIVGLSGGSTQISIFDKSKLILTQNLRIGSLRVRDRLQEASALSSNYEDLVRELVHFNLESFKKTYLKNRSIDNVILNGDFITEMIFRDAKHRDRSTRMLTREEFEQWYRKIEKKSIQDLAIENDLPVEYASLLRPSAIIYNSLITLMDAKTIWAPGVHLSRGLAYEFAERNNILKVTHNFEEDIVSSAQTMAKKYDTNRAHVENMEMTALAIFDALEPLHGLDGKERLMLRVAIMLHDVGKYISYNQIGENTYNIIMSNEIIGLSHPEREIVAMSCGYMWDPLPQFEDIVMGSSLNKNSYLTVAAFIAIMRLANGLDRSHMQKVQTIDCELKKQKLNIRIGVSGNFALESGLLKEEEDFFQEVFGIRPVVKVKRIA